MSRIIERKKIKEANKSLGRIMSSDKDLYFNDIDETIKYFKNITISIHRDALKKNPEVESSDVLKTDLEACNLDSTLIDFTVKLDDLIDDLATHIVTNGENIKKLKTAKNLKRFTIVELNDLCEFNDRTVEKMSDIQNFFQDNSEFINTL